MNRILLRTRDTGESGSVVVEAAISFLVLLILMMGITDIGRLVNGYIVLTQVSNEATRHLSRVLQLEIGEYETADIQALSSASNQQQSPSNSMVIDDDLIGGDGAPVVPVNHKLVHERVDIMLETLQELLPLEELNVTTTYMHSGSLDSRQNGSVSVVVSGKYKGLFPAFDGIRLSVSQTGEYLAEGS